MKIIPHGERVFVLLDGHKDVLKTITADDGTEKSIYAPNSATERQRCATVLAIGNGITKWKDGDRVVVSSYSGVPVEIPGRDMPAGRYRMFTEDEILGYVEEEDKLDIEGKDQPKEE